MQQRGVTHVLALVIAITMAITTAITTTACHPAPAPPPTLAELQARLGNLDPDTVQHLTEGKPLLLGELEDLARSGDRDVLVLLLAHPSATPAMLASFASYPDDAVRAAVARNVSTPAATLRFLRVTNRPDIVNRALAMNASTPVDLLLDMRTRGEAGDVSLAANPSLPVDVMRDIHRRGDEVAKLNLARNRAVPQDLRDALIRDESSAVRAAAAAARH